MSDHNLNRHTIYQRKDMTGSKGHSKSCSLFVLVSGSVTDNNVLETFLRHRMGNPTSVQFELANSVQVDKDKQIMIVAELRLASQKKLNNARYLLHKSNKGASNKVFCYSTEEEARGIAAKGRPDNEGALRDALKAVVERAKDELEKHQEKINETRKAIQEIEQTLGAKTGHSPELFETLTNEMLAREDKLTELDRQREEFTHYLQAMKMKILEARHDARFDRKLKEIRIAFGIECMRLKNALPMYARREDILTTIRNNQVSMILGETGSGKSTQMVQYLYQAGMAGDWLIACTQPRKIAAISLATHVSSELASSVGQTVGYQVGMQTRKTALTKVLFMTDHVLLNECLKDENLSSFSCVIIDEAHERSIFTDLLLGMLKKCMTRRPELRIVITSATIDPAVFVAYFGGADICPVLKVSGRTFPVDVRWENRSDNDAPFPEDYESKALNKAVQLHTERQAAEGDILVFLTSPLEAERCCEGFKKRVQGNNYQCLQLHGRLKTEEQQLAFAPNPHGKRKVVFATNSAETSITIPGIRFVIDTGVVKEMRYDPKKNMNSLDVRPVSRSSADQRKGRAGRVSSGICYRLYNEDEFDSMEKGGCPEILRVHLGQSMLKLMELGVNPMSFDFVQAPPAESMEAALRTLQEIRAVEGHTITELGKWIAKLPVEPRLGVLIKNGLDEGVPVEALVLAASSGQSGVFFRAGSQEEKKASDLRKVRFCHAGGDLLTTLNVFREWDTVNEKLKGKWCNDNSVNGKSMKGIRDTVNEITNTLKKDLDVVIKHEFQRPEEADGKLQKLIFLSMKSNICYYLGHEKAGYITTDRLQHVKVHPSSCLPPLGLTPTWVVYGQLLKTSDDFITNITPVREECIDNAIRDKLIFIDKHELEGRKVVQALKMPIGRSVFFKFVGRMHQNRRLVEDNIRASCDNTVVVVEADKHRSHIALFCASKYRSKAAKMVEKEVEEARGEMLNEVREEDISKANTSVRILLHNGLGVQTILMPGEFRTVNINTKESNDETVTEDTIRASVQPCGKIESIFRPFRKQTNQGTFWGSVTFVSAKDAASAIEHISKLENCKFTAFPRRSGKVMRFSQQKNIQLKLTWCRRTVKGICYVTCNQPEDLPNLLCQRITISGNFVSVQRSKRDSDLYIKGLLPTVTDEQIRHGLNNALGRPATGNIDQYKIITPRHEAAFENDEVRNTVAIVTRAVAKYIPEADFNVNVLEYKQKTVCAIAFVYFTDLNQLQQVVQGFTMDHPSVRSCPIEIVQLSSSVHILRGTFDILQKEIKSFLDNLPGAKGNSSSQLRQLKSGHFTVDITADTAENLAKRKVALDNIVNGDVIEGEYFTRMQRALVQTKIKEIEHNTSTIITIDKRRERATIQGLIENRVAAREIIANYLDQVGEATAKTIPLKGTGMSNGLLKELLVLYGSTLDGIQKEAGLSTMQVNLRNHELTLIGSEDAICKGMTLIEAVKQKLAESQRNVEDDDLPECPICLCPVELSDFCALEYCGHAYCKVCLTSQIQNAVKDHVFPVVCAVSDCSKPLVIKDLLAQIKQGSVKMEEVVKSALNSFVSQHQTEYKFCFKPDCDMIYRVTTDRKPFLCPLCNTNVCTTCHIKYHEGMTCEAYKAYMLEDGDNSLRTWIVANPTKRKMCPKCFVGIEKIDGCEHMHCTACSAHICWKCLEYFASGSECYGHLSTHHGSFM